jgi:hypothetical protein
MIAHNEGSGPFVNGPWRRKVYTVAHSDLVAGLNLVKKLD